MIKMGMSQKLTILRGSMHPWKTTLSRDRLNQAGLSLIELMVGVGLLGLATTITMLTVDFAGHVIGDLRARNATLELSQSLGQGLSSDACKFLTQNSGSVSAPHQINKTAADAAASAVNYEDDITNRLPLMAQNGVEIIPAAGGTINNGALVVQALVLRNPRKIDLQSFVFDVVLRTTGTRSTRGYSSATQIMVNFDPANSRVLGCLDGLEKNDLTRQEIYEGPSSLGAPYREYEITVRPGMRRVRIEAWGGGGGGGGGGNSLNISGLGINGPQSVTWGSGGGSGAYSMALITVTPGQKLRLSVGNGGQGSLYVDITAGPGNPSCVSNFINPSCDIAGSPLLIRSPGGMGGTRGAQTRSTGYGGGYDALGVLQLSEFTPSPHVYIRTGGGHGSSVSPGLRCQPGTLNCTVADITRENAGFPSGGETPSAGVSRSLTTYSVDPTNDGRTPGGGGAGSLHNSQRGGNGAPGRIILWW